MNPSHNILIVDDEIVFATQIGDILSDLGHEATLLHSAEYALTRLSAPHSFDLMLLDVHMPGMTGIELVRATADLPNRPPIILMTAFSSLPTALECLKLGAEDYITKPFDLDLLLLTIDRALDRANMQRQNRELNRMLMVHTHNTVRGQQAMRGLVQMLNLLPASRDLPQAMLEVLSYVHRILESDYSTLTLQMEQHPIICRLPADTNLNGTAADLQEALLHVMLSGQPMRGGEPSADDAPECFARLPETLFMPVCSQGRTVGVVQIARPSNPTGFTETDEQILELICAEIALLGVNLHLYDNCEKMTIGAISSLAKTLEQKDHGTGDHSSRTHTYLERMLDRLNLPKDQRDTICFAMQLHDIGKIRVPNDIINKPGPLDDEEWAVMRMHPQWGFDILNSDCLLSQVATLVRHHHERYDGTGYPDGLKGDSIPFGSRFLSIIDAFDAMNSDRPYRTSLGLDAAVREIRSNVGTQFDPELTELFLSTVHELAQA
ncbi:hypothetical protein CVU37_02175 [candidate division BRC1 bacterium HGW-BRC1-1]|jgi:response regulator RpfG family c-di-GMP phosphodiesterase|nr:MAG: hypothetical protein CVU37_02175 [candidate division BRC1 bacterium HGW-BRC1-1]